MSVHTNKYLCALGIFAMHHNSGIRHVGFSSLFTIMFVNPYSINISVSLTSFVPDESEERHVGEELVEVDGLRN